VDRGGDVKTQSLRLAAGFLPSQPANTQILPRPPPEPEASRRACPARNQAEQRGGPESERDERMTRVPLYRSGRDGATPADLSFGVGAEVARPALQRRLAGEARHLHKNKSHGHEGHKQRMPRPARRLWNGSPIKPDTDRIETIPACGTAVASDDPHTHWAKYEDVRSAVSLIPALAINC
jgi:hypothetical protein